MLPIINHTNLPTLEIPREDAEALVTEAKAGRASLDEDKAYRYLASIDLSRANNKKAYARKALLREASEGKLDADPAPDFSAEILEEEQDKADYERGIEGLMEFRGWSEPGIELHGPYIGHPEYSENTFISIYREAKEANVSMHEVCRRKGLRYEHLIY